MWWCLRSSTIKNNMLFMRKINTAQAVTYSPAHCVWMHVDVHGSTCESFFLCVAVLMSWQMWEGMESSLRGSAEHGGKHSSHHLLHMTTVTWLLPAEARDQQESGLKDDTGSIELCFVPSHSCDWWLVSSHSLSLTYYLSRDFKRKMSLNKCTATVESHLLSYLPH